MTRKLIGITVPIRFWPDGVSLIAGGVAIVIGVGVLAGWTLDIPVLVQLAPRFIVTPPSTAVGIVLAGSAMLLLQTPMSSRRLMVGRVLATAVFALGALSFISRMVGRDIAYVGALYYDKSALYPYRPVGLMATNSTITFMLVGVALLLVSSNGSDRRRIARRLAIAGAAIAGVAILGYLYGARALYAFDRAA